MLRLNLGCGNYPKHGWLNCDKKGLYQRWEYTNIKDRIFELDLTKFPYPFSDNSVDFITTSHCLNQIEEKYIVPIMKELYRILKPGGIVRVTDDDVENPLSTYYKLPHFHALWYIGLNRIRRYLQEAGFRTHLLNKDLTLSYDSSIKIDNHKDVPDNSKFFIEGVKLKSKDDFTRYGSHVQYTLFSALRYFLYDSIISQGFKQSVLRKILPNKPLWLYPDLLIKVINAFEMIGVPCYVYQKFWQQYNAYNKVTEECYAETLSLLYRFWDEILEQERKVIVTSNIIPLGQVYANWLKNGGEKPKYKAVHSLRTIIKKYGGEYFLRAIVHGSLATLDDMEGFSDMDTAFIIRSSHITDSTKLIKLRRLSAQIITCTYTFDPFMHHGPYYITEIDLKWYPESFFPPVIFKYGVELSDNYKEIKIVTRQSDDFTEIIFDESEKFFHNISNIKPFIKDSFDIEWVLGNTMILPALYLQCKTGSFRYKRDTFPIAERDFSREEWYPIRIASELRMNLGYRVKPSRFLTFITGWLDCPGLLHRRMRKHSTNVKRAQEVIAKLGVDFPQKVLTLIKTMRNKLSLGNLSVTLNQVKHDKKMSSSFDYDITIHKHTLTDYIKDYFNDIKYGPFTEIPEKVTVQRYEEITEFLISHWISLPVKPVAIYRLGEIGAPGISDLDFIIVFDDNDKVDLIQFDPKTFPHNVKQFFSHHPYFCTTNMWQYLHGWYPTFNIKHLWGNDLPKPTISNEHIKGNALWMLIDYLIVKIPMDLLRLVWHRPIYLRNLLAVLHSVRYIIKLTEQSTIKIPHNANEVIEKVRSLRTEWFELADSQRMNILSNIIPDVCEFIGKLIRSIDETIIINIDNCNKDDMDGNYFNNKSLLFRFLNKWDFGSAVEAAFKYYSDTGNIIWTNPASFLHIFSVYADECNELKKYFNVHGIHTKLQWDGGIWNQGLRYHARAMVEYGKMSKKLGIHPQKYVALSYFNNTLYNRLYTIYIRARRKLHDTKSRLKNLLNSCIY